MGEIFLNKENKLVLFSDCVIEFGVGMYSDKKAEIFTLIISQGS